MSIEVRTEEGLATIILNRPEKKNALTLDMRIALGDHFERLARDTSVRAVLLTANGETFCAGADLQEFGVEDPVSARQRLRTAGHRLILNLYKLEKPVIAAVNGAAIGLGWTMALACDQIIAATTARFSMTYRNIGLVPDCGATYFLTRRLGTGRSFDIFYSARSIDAHEAVGMGLVERAVGPEAFPEIAASCAKTLAEAPTFSLGLTKKLIQSSETPRLEDFLEFESLIPPQLRHTQDYVEGVKAFREKRKPKFVGR